MNQRKTGIRHYVNELYNNVPCLSSCTLALGTQVALTAGSITPGINFDLGLGGRVSGTVRDAGTLLPLADVSVSLLNAGGQTVSSGFTSRACASRSTTSGPASPRSRSSSASPWT